MSVPVAVSPSFATSKSTAFVQYEQLLKRVLTHRMRYVAFHSVLATHVLLSVASMDFSREGLGTILRLFWLRTIFFTFLCGIALLPNLIERKKALVSYTFATPLTRFAAMHHFLFVNLHNTFSHIVWRIISGYSSMLFYIILVDPSRRKSRLTLFVRIPGRDSLQLNDRFVYLSFLVLTVTILHGLANVFEQRRVLRFKVEYEPIPTRLKLIIRKRCLLVLRYLAFTNLIYYFVYTMLRRPLIKFFLLQVFPLGSLIRPYLFSILRKSAPTLGTFLTGFGISTVVTLTIEINDCLFDVYMTQPTEVSQYSPTPNPSLLDGLKSSVKVFQIFAFRELSTIARYSEERRKVIYKDVNTNPSIYCQIHREIQKQIEICTTHVVPKQPTPETESKLIPPVSHSPVTTTKRSGAKPATIATTSGLVPVVPSKKSFFVKFFESVVSPPSIPEPQVTISSQVPAIFRPAVEKVEKQVNDLASSTSGEVVKTVKSLEAQVKSFIPRHHLTALHDWLFEESLTMKVRKDIPDMILIELACLAQAHLTGHSINEDDYGTVQVTIPEVFQNALALLDAISDYVDKITQSLPPDSVKKREELDHIAGHFVLFIRDSMETMLGAFVPYLNGLKLPTSVVFRLRSLAGARRKL